MARQRSFSSSFSSSEAFPIASIVFLCSFSSLATPSRIFDCDLPRPLRKLCDNFPQLRRKKRMRRTGRKRKKKEEVTEITMGTLPHKAFDSWSRQFTRRGADLIGLAGINFSMKWPFDRCLSRSSDVASVTSLSSKWALELWSAAGHRIWCRHVLSRNAIRHLTSSSKIFRRDTDWWEGCGGEGGWVG